MTHGITFGEIVLGLVSEGFALTVTERGETMDSAESNASEKLVGIPLACHYRLSTRFSARLGWSACDKIFLYLAILLLLVE